MRQDYQLRKDMVQDRMRVVGADLVRDSQNVGALPDVVFQLAVRRLVCQICQFGPR